MTEGVGGLVTRGMTRPSALAIVFLCAASSGACSSRMIVRDAGAGRDGAALPDARDALDAAGPPDAHVPPCEDACAGPRCGDGVLQPERGEECDAFDFGGVDSCVARGFTSGELRCTDTCAVDASACAACDEGSCACGCVGGECRTNTSDASCGASCVSCAAGQSCRYDGTGFACVSTVPDGSTCIYDHECTSGVCADGICRSGCSATGRMGCVTCCDPLAMCRIQTGGVRSCCFPDGTFVPRTSAEPDCTVCCAWAEGRSCTPGPTGFTCGE
jgi:hypothetical protein